jgi:hypothetical protein
VYKNYFQLKEKKKPKYSAKDEISARKNRSITDDKIKMRGHFFEDEMNF